MSTQLSNNLVTIFDSEVKQIFQTEGFLLKETVRYKNGNAKQFKFPVYGKLMAEEHIPGVEGSIQNAAQRQATIIVKDRKIISATDQFEALQVNYDDRKEAATAHAMAMGRDSDQLIIDALVASSTAKTVANNISGATADLTFEALKNAAKQLRVDGVNTMDCTFIGHVTQREALEGELQATSGDFISKKPLETGDWNGYLGIGRYIFIGDMAEGGLPKDSSNDRTCFLYHRQAVGYAASMDLRTRVDWDAKLSADLIQSFYSGNAGEIDPLGVVKITCRESA